MEQNNSLSGSAVLEVDYACVSNAPQHAGKRSRLEEQNDEEPPNDYEASPGSKRTKTDKQSEVDADNGGAKTKGKDPKEQNGMKIESGDPAGQREEDKADPCPSAVMSPVLTRRRANARTRAAIEQKLKEERGFTTPEKGKGSLKSDAPEDAYGTRIDNERWIVHQITEDYVDFVGRMMYPGTQFRPYGYDVQNRSYPLQGISALGFLKSKLRRPTVVERWSPYEVAVFEAALLHHGKEFHHIAKEVGTKTTREVVDFYYTWKKTAHYKKWKETFVSDDELLEMQSPVKVKGGRK